MENNPNTEVGLSIMENATKIDENLNSTAAAIKSSTTSTNPATVAEVGLSVEVRLSILETQIGNIDHNPKSMTPPATATDAGAGAGIRRRSLSMARLDKELADYVEYNGYLWFIFLGAILIGGLWKNHLDHGLHGWYWFLAAFWFCAFMIWVYFTSSDILKLEADGYEYLRKQERKWCRGRTSCFLIYRARIRHVLQRLKEEEEGKINTTNINSKSKSPPLAPGPGPHNV